jgi:hypothetical protein
MAFRRSISLCWLLAVACFVPLTAQTVEELRAKLQQAEIDKAVMAERARNDHPTSAVLIALIGALPALFAAWLTFEGNKMVKRAAELSQSHFDRASARAEVIATETTDQNEMISRQQSQLEKIVVKNADPK